MNGRWERQTVSSVTEEIEIYYVDFNDPEHSWNTYSSDFTGVKGLSTDFSYCQPGLESYKTAHYNPERHR